MTEITLYDKDANVREDVLFYSDWNEISKKHLLYIGEYWQVWQDMVKSKVSLMRAKALLFVRFAECKKLSKKNLVKKILSADNESVYELTELSNFIFTKNNLTKCPTPFFKKWFRKYYAPSDRLSNIVGFEFVFADKFHIDYRKNRNEKDLDLMIGCLYRPRKLFSSTRKKFDKDKIEKYAKAASKLKYAEKQIILLWYMGCREAIINSNKNLFKSEGDSSDSTWIDVFLEMAGSKFGSFEETGHTEMFLIFKELQHSAKKAEKMKKK